jgi:hypothetical protein
LLTDVQGLITFGIAAVVVGVCAFTFAQSTERQTPKLRLLLKRSFG